MGTTGRGVGQGEDCARERKTREPSLCYFRINRENKDKFLGLTLVQMVNQET